MKPIHFHLFDPREPRLFFKSKKTDHAEAHIIKCGNSENCDLYKRGQCAWKPVFGYTRCPYGQYEQPTGPTGRSKSIGEWCRNMREQYKGVPYIKEPPKKLAVIGDYIYFPYSHATLNEHAAFKEKGGLFNSGNCLIKKEDWTIETIQKIIDFRPQALFGGEITSYQREEMPLFLTHLEEVMPNLYSALIEARPDIVQRYNLTQKNYVGRKALVKTLAPCTFETKGSREGNYKVKWTWDGTKLTTKSSHAYNSTWGDIDNYDSIETTMIPSEKSAVQITDNNQVGPQTIFLD